MKSIHDLAAIWANATDKKNADHSFAGENYLHIYERYFERLRPKPVKLLEIGVRGGYSLRLWRDYFAAGDIHGVDIDPSCVEHEAHRISVHTGDQSDSVRLAALAAEHGPFDVVIDDGSHVTGHILISLQALWPHVAPHGFYCIEDLRISYHGVDDGWPGMRFNTTSLACSRGEMDAVFLDTIKRMDNMEGDVRAMHFHPMVCVIEKV